MSQIFRRPLVVALTAALGVSLLSGPAIGQSNPNIRSKPSESRTETKPPQYPNATRQVPEGKVSPKLVKQLQALQQSYEKGDWIDVMAKADALVTNPAAENYEKSYSYSMAGNAAANADDMARAAGYFSKAIEANGLDNDGHYSTMYNLAVIQYNEEKYADALATIDRFLDETKAEKPEYLSLKAGALGELNRPNEAATIYAQLVAKNPDDKRVLMNAVAALQNAEKFPAATKLLEDAYARGMLSEARELRALYVSYINVNRFEDAQRVIEAGVEKGTLVPGNELAKDYQVLAQNAYLDDKIPLAIELYKRAASMASDGEASLNLAKVLDYAGKKAEAKTAAKQALEKGVKKPEDANRILAR